ncbi:MAG: phosphatidylglycerophosphatase A [Desulfobacteraceae bacterium]|nr:MAG: phosphatidylglycerophosphatase A [Desulfobacteraceae bacterium]
MNFREKSVIFLATGFFAGNIPIAPGTIGTIVGLLFCFFLSGADLFYMVLFQIFFVIIAIWVADEAEKILKKKDPGCIIIDEIAGIMVTLFGLPFNVVSVISGFFVFRFLDVVKPFPIRTIENKLSGGAGIVMDDIAAGIIGNCLLRAIFHVIG